MKKRDIIIAFLVCGLLIGAALGFSQTRMTEGVTVGGLDIGGMTVWDAYCAMRNASEAILETASFTAALPEETLTLSPAGTDARLKTCSALWAAWQVGRFGDQSPDIGLLPHLRLDRDYLQAALATYADTHDTSLTPSHYELLGEMPNLEIERQSGNCQTLSLTLGLPTSRLNQQGAMDRILKMYDMAFTGINTVSDFKVDILETPDAPDLEAISQDVSIAPVDDSLNMETYELIPGAWGYGFDLDTAKELVAQGSCGETVSIPMELQEPEIFQDEVYFRDVLGHYETKHTSDENRNNNLRRACESMNGLILQPGEVFSYNDTLGPRTKENGYLRAGAYAGWELVMSYGGGICQGSSTIYCAALYADLEIVHRVNHGLKVGYLPIGLDATVSWNGPDFQFRNSTHFPIKITAEVSDGYVKVAILGTEERDYYIEMESESGVGSDVIVARSYKCKYDRETGELISRELEARSHYMR